MSFETDAVAIDFSSLLSGKLQLKQPTQAIAQVVLSEAGINQAFGAELVKNRLVNLTNPVSFTDIQIEIMSENRIKINAKADLGSEELIPIAMTMTLAIEKCRKITFKNPKINLELAPESQRQMLQTLALTLAEILDNMVDLDRFDLDGVKMRLNRLQTEGKKLIFRGYAEVERIPNLTFHALVLNQANYVAFSTGSFAIVLN